MKEMPDDLKVIEGRLRSHGEKMSGSSEEFRGRLESRLEHAWDQRAWSVARPRYFAFVPQVAIACAVLVLAFVSADVTTRSLHVSQDEKWNEPDIQSQPVRDMKEESASQKFFSALVPQYESKKAPAAGAPVPGALEQMRPAALHDMATTTSFMASVPQDVHGGTFMIWFLLYVLGFCIVWIIVRRIHHRMRV